MKRKITKALFIGTMVAFLAACSSNEASENAAKTEVKEAETQETETPPVSQEKEDTPDVLETTQTEKPIEETADSVLTPDEIVNYEKPEEVSDDFGAFHYQYEEAFYRLPAPVSAYVENGWVIDEENTEKTIAVGGSTKVTLTKDKKIISFHARNFREEPCAPEDGFITTLGLVRIKSQRGTPYTSFRIARNIMLDMSEEDLIKALEGTDYEVDTKDGHKVYLIKPHKDSSSSIKISLYDDEPMVASIMLTYGDYNEE